LSAIFELALYLADIVWIYLGSIYAS